MARIDITIQQGAVFVRTIRLRVKSTGLLMDLVGWQSILQIKDSLDAVEPLEESVGVLESDPDTGDTNRIFRHKIVKSKTDLLPAKRLYYQIEMIPPSGVDDTIRPIEGVATVSRQVIL